MRKMRRIKKMMKRINSFRPAPIQVKLNLESRIPMSVSILIQLSLYSQDLSSTRYNKIRNSRYTQIPY